MKWWNQWTRKHEEGWAERRRQFQKRFADTIQAAAGEKVPAVAGVTVPEIRGTVRNRGEK